MQVGREVGVITRFFPKISVAVVDLKAPLAVGDKIVIVGKATQVEQTVESLQMEHKPVDRAKAGQSVRLQVASRVREEDRVYEATP